MIYPIAGTPFFILAGDLNGDGSPDLVPGGPPVLLNDGMGGFSPSPVASSGMGSLDAVLADFNSDGKLDLAGGIGVRLGDGAGGFGAPTNFNTGAFLHRALVVADFDSDGKPDVATANTVNGNVSIFLNGYQPPAPAPPPASCKFPDIVTARPGGRIGFTFSNDGLVTQRVTARPFFNGACFSIFPGAPQLVEIAPGDSYSFALDGSQCPAASGGLSQNSLVVVETSSCGTRYVQVRWIPQR